MLLWWWDGGERWWRGALREVVVVSASSSSSSSELQISLMARSNSEAVFKKLAPLRHVTCAYRLSWHSELATSVTVSEWSGWHS